MADETNYYEEGECKLFNNSANKDITPWIISVNWGGTLGTSARTLDFSIAYNTKEKDANFVNATVNLGDTISFSFSPKGSKNAYKLFNGVVFLRNRNTDGYTMEFKAYDKIIYLAKNEVQMKFVKQTAKSIISSVCSPFGVGLGTVHEDFNLVCDDFIADKMTASEVIQKCMDYLEANFGYRYKAVMLNGALNLLRADGSDIVTNFILSDKANIVTARHGDSLEDMVNRVAIANDNGDIVGYVKLDNEIQKYGLIQKVYKYNPKEQTERAAKILLKKVKYHSSISGLGNVQCVSGYVVQVTEEHLKGYFMIIADRHTFENGNHTMELTLDFITRPNDAANATTEGNVNPMPTKNNGLKRAGKGKKFSKVGLSDGIDAFKGASYTPDPANGCVWAATGIASYYSPWAAEEFNNGVVYVPTLIEDAKAAGMYERYGEGTLEPGDIIVYDDSHVVVATGGYGYAGNSTKQRKVVTGTDFTNMSGKYATGIIKTSRY